MIKIVHDFLARNIGWKLFSIITAIILWGVVINIKNPAETRSFIISNIELMEKESLESKSLVIANEKSIANSKVVIKVRGNRLALDKLEANKKNITANVNLKSEIYGMSVNEPNEVSVNINLPTIGTESFEIVERSPKSVEVILEKIRIVTKELKVVTIGEPKKGFVLLQPETNPATIQVKGASSLIDKIDSVKVTVDVSDISSDISTTTQPIAYDIDGNEIQGLELNIKEVQVTIPVNEYKRVPIDASANQGMPQDGYTLTGIDCHPDYIEVVGDSESISKFTKLEWPVINLSGLNATTEIVRDIRALLPPNISIRNGTPNEVKVTVKIAKEEIKEFQIPIDNITINGAILPYDIQKEAIMLNLRGLSTVINNIAVKDIKGTIDISGYDVGAHDIPVKFNLPSGVTLIGDNPTVNVTIINTDNIEQELESTTQQTVDISIDND